MIAVVTGTSGFIGSHLVAELLARGATVRALVRPNSIRASRFTHTSDRLSFHNVDVLNASAVEESDVWNGASHVFHVAGLTTATSLAQFRKGNVQPIANILVALNKRRSRPRVVCVSSQAAAGPASSRNTPLRESDDASPIEWYGISKHEAEQLVATFAGKIQITIVRPPAVYGPGDRDFLAAYKQATHPFALHAINPDFWFDLVHVRDVVSALHLSAEHPAAVGRTYFLASDAPLQWGALYDLIARNAGVASRQVRVPGALLKLGALAGDVFGLVTKRTPLLNSQKLALARAEWWLCDSTRIRTELGWQPQVTPQIGVRETYLWYVDAGWLSRKQPVAPKL